MSDKEEHELRCGESFPRPAPKPRPPLRPRRDVPSLLLSGFSMELEARIWFAAPQRSYLRAMKTRPCAPGKIKAPPRLTSQNISPAPFRLFSGGAPDAAGIFQVVGKRGNTVTLLNPPRLRKGGPRPRKAKTVLESHPALFARWFSVQFAHLADLLTRLGNQQRLRPLDPFWIGHADHSFLYQARMPED